MAQLSGILIDLGNNIINIINELKSLSISIKCETLNMIVCQIMSNHAGVTMSLLTKSFNDDVLYPIILRLVIHSLILLRDLSDSLAGDLNAQILIYASSSTTTTNPGHHKSRSENDQTRIKITSNQNYEQDNSSLNLNSTRMSSLHSTETFRNNTKTSSRRRSLSPSETRSTSIMSSGTSFICLSDLNVSHTGASNVPHMSPSNANQNSLYSHGPFIDHMRSASVASSLQTQLQTASDVYCIQNLAEQLKRFESPQSLQSQGGLPGCSFQQSYQGTIFSAPNFYPDADCQAFNHAMKGAGTNEHAILDIISNRSNAQRQQIKFRYKTVFGVDLVQQLCGESSGSFKEIMIALFDIPANNEAYALHTAFSFGMEGTLREILFTRSNMEIRAINDAYRQNYNKDLEEEINHRVRGKNFKRMLISALQGGREELSPQQIQRARQAGIESVIDRNRARQDADDLYKAGAGKLGTDEETFNAILSRRSYYQLRATLEEYQKKHYKDIAQVIKSEFSDDEKDAYLTLITCIRDRPSFFAERLHKAISGLGTKDSTLIRVIITRSQIDLAQIKQRYQQMYNRSLAQDVAGNTSEDCKQILLSIIK